MKAAPSRTSGPHTPSRPSLSPRGGVRSERRKHRSGRLALVAFVALAVSAGAACGDDGASTPTTPTHLSTAPGTANGTPASATIGAAGGTLTAADGGLVLTIPPGALTSDTVLTVTPVTAPASNAIATYRLEPEGTTFATPATLTFRATNAGVAYPGLAFLGIALHEADGTWRFQADVVKDATAKTLAIPIPHFSEYSMLSGYQLQPIATTAEVGGAAEFGIVACADPVMLALMNGEVPEDTPVDIPDPLLYECQPVFFQGARAYQWSVDGVEGGDSTHGTIQANGDLAAIFTAPGDKPDPATVSVSAWFDYSSATSLKDMLVGRVTITNNDKYFGSFVVTANGPFVNWTGTGSAKWQTGSNPYEYTITGSVKSDQTIFSVGGSVCTLISAEQPFTFDAGSIHEMQSSTTIYWALPSLAWAANCCDSGGGNCQVVDTFLSLTWASGCAAEWATLDPAEWSMGNLKGSYTWPSSPCIPVYPGVPTATVEWLFLTYAN